MSQSPLNALALLNAVVEGESPREFLKRFRPPKGWDRVGGLETSIGEYSFDDRGIENQQYWQGVSTTHTRWDEVYTGIGDNPQEAANDAIDQAAMDGWNVGGIANDLPEQPTVSDEIMDQCRAEALQTVGRADYETDEDYKAAVEEEAESVMELGDWELSYYVVLWIRRMTAEDAELVEPEPPAQESLHEAEPGAARSFIKGLRGGVPSEWPTLRRWYPSDNAGITQRRAFYPGTRWQHGQRVTARKPLKNTLFLKYGKPGEYALRYHRTDVLYYDGEGNCHVYNRGYKTTSTQARINQFAPYGWRLFTYQYTWYWFNVNWPESVRQEQWADQRRRRKPRSQYWIPFSDGDIIRSGGTLKFSDGTATPEGTIHRQQLFPFQEGKYLDKLAWIKRVKAKHATMKEVKKRMKELEDLDKPSNQKKYRW